MADINKAQLAEFLDVSRQTVHEYSKKGVLVEKVNEASKNNTFVNEKHIALFQENDVPLTGCHVCGEEFKGDYAHLMCVCKECSAGDIHDNLHVPKCGKDAKAKMNHVKESM